jgi:hypothetical protein
VILSFVPYPWTLHDKSGLSLNAKEIKIVKAGHLAESLVNLKKRKLESSQSSPKRMKTVYLEHSSSPSTINLGF